MTYAYGMKGAPAVGNGLGGLPRRQANDAATGKVGSLIVSESNPGESYLLANGAAVLKNDYKKLYEVIGDAFTGIIDSSFEAKDNSDSLGTNVIGGAGVFVTQSSSPKISVDGESWVAASPSGNLGRSSFVGGVIFASEGNTSKRYTINASKTGLELIGSSPLPALSGPQTVIWGKVVEGNGVHVCAGYGLSSGNLSDYAAARSTDGGETWTEHAVPNKFWGGSAAFGNGVFVIGGGDSSTSIISSSDGITWTSRSTPSGTLDIAFGNGVFISVSGDSTSMRSVDGISWEPITIAGKPNKIEYLDGFFVAASNNSAAISQDGVAWESREFPTGDFRALAAQGGRFLALGTGNPTPVAILPRYSESLFSLPKSTNPGSTYVKVK